VDTVGQPLAEAQLKPVALATGSLRETASGDFAAPAALPAELADELATETAADGSFVLGGLPSQGSAFCMLSAPGFGAPWVNWDLAAPVTIRLRRAGSVSGSLTSAEDPEAAAGVELHVRMDWKALETTDSRFRLCYSEKGATNKDGTFSFKELPPGEYLITPRIGSALPFYTEPTEPLELKPNATVSGVTIPMFRAIGIRGQVVDKQSGASIKGVKVVISRIHERGGGTWTEAWNEATTDENGRFSAYVKPGKLVVGIAAPAPEGYLWRQRDPPKIEAYKDTQWPVTQLDRATKIEGIVVNPSGEPVRGAEVRVQYGFGTETAESDTKGRFSLDRVDPENLLSLWARTDAATTDGATVIDPAEQKGPVRLEVSRQEAFRICGTVVDGAGRPIRNARVSLNCFPEIVTKPDTRSGARSPIGTFLISDQLGTYTTDGAGRFKTRALWPADNYQIGVMADGYRFFESRERIEGGPVRSMATSRWSWIATCILPPSTWGKC
jgi:hypothetical protein